MDTFTGDASVAGALGVPLPVSSEQPPAAADQQAATSAPSMPSETTDVWTANFARALQAQHARVREFLQAQRDRWRQIAARFTRQIETLQAEVHALQASNEGLGVELSARPEGDRTEVAEAAAVPVIDDIRGRVVEVYVSLKPGFEPSAALENKVSAAIDEQIGKIARPKNVWIVPDMPKTRSGKIMRRVIASISNFADVGDVTTLANPEIVESIRQYVQSSKVAKDDVPRELTEAEFEEIKKFGGE